jgi:hypothetical protein
MPDTEQVSFDGFLDELSKSPALRRRHPCHVQDFIDSLKSAEAKKQVEAALANTSLISRERLTKALNEKGYAYGDSTIRRHRAKMCSCYR